MINLFKKVLLTTTLVLGFTATAQATPIISLSDAGQVHSSVAGVTEIDFNSSCGYSSCEGDFAIVSGNLPNFYAQPLGVDSPYLTVPKPSTSTLSGLFGLGVQANYFGLFWGSIDNYNSISFYLSNALVASFSGSDIVGQFADGNQLSFNSNRFINFDFGNELFDSVKLTSTGFAFESDNHTFKQFISVPEPSNGMLMLLGLVGLGIARRQAKKS
jgi:hypothetical protein